MNELDDFSSSFVGYPGKLYFSEKNNLQLVLKKLKEFPRLWVFLTGLRYHPEVLIVVIENANWDDWLENDIKSLAKFEQDMVFSRRPDLISKYPWVSQEMKEKYSGNYELESIGL